MSSIDQTWIYPSQTSYSANKILRFAQWITGQSTCAWILLTRGHGAPYECHHSMSFQNTTC